MKPSYLPLSIAASLLTLAFEREGDFLGFVDVLVTINEGQACGRYTGSGSVPQEK